MKIYGKTAALALAILLAAGAFSACEKKDDNKSSEQTTSEKETIVEKEETDVEPKDTSEVFELPDDRDRRVVHKEYRVLPVRTLQRIDQIYDLIRSDRRCGSGRNAYISATSFSVVWLFFCFLGFSGS